MMRRSKFPYVYVCLLILAMIGAVIATGLAIETRRPEPGRLASLDQQHSSAAKRGELRSISQPKIAAADPGTARPTGLGNSFGTENKLHSLSNATTPATPTTTVARSTSIPQVVEMTIGEDTEQSSGASPLLRSARSPYSSAVANNGERDREGEPERSQEQDAGRPQRGEAIATSQTPDQAIDGQPREERLVKAHEFKGDLRNLPRTRPPERERRELEPPATIPRFYVPPGGVMPQTQTQETQPPINPQANAPAPPPISVFEGLDRFNWGAGSPPDTNGDVGPNDYIQTVNTSIGIFRKSDGFQEAAFTFNTFMSQGAFGNLCDTNNFGDPVVLYDSFEDRWIITDFAFLTDISGNVLAPAYQCIAASQSGNPISGGWNFYSRQISDNLNDYPKFGIWPDGLYMSANMFSFGAGSTFQKVRVWAFNKAQMYAGSPTVKVVSFDIGGGDFTVLPSNARLQTGTPPAGRPNLFLSTQLFLNALTVYKFHVDWDHISLSTLTGPDTPISATSWPAFAAAVPQPGTAQTLDSLSNRAMVQNQYTNFSGTESLWVSHTVRRGNTSGFAAPRWYQVNVNGGTVNPTIPQAATWDPDAANVVHRWMPSLALDRAGNLAMGYSVSNSTTVFPSIRYAGRLAADPANTFSQTEQTFFTGTASQTSSNRWGDYSAMTLDPDGCTFWYTTEYANPADQTFNHRWLTKFGSISAFPGCTPVGAGGTVSGTVTVNPGGAPISGATVNLGARSTTTDGSGIYSFTSIPAGTYPSMDASKPGFGSASASSIVVTDGNTTTQDFALTDAPDSSCITDTTQSDFLTGVATNLDLDTSPGDVTLVNLALDQQNTAGTTTGTGFGTPAWTGQTFIPSVNGQLVKAEIQLFCNGCGATPPNLTLSVRNTAGGLPTGADLASVTIPGSAFGSGATTTYTASFGSPATLTSGTQYALILRPVSAPAGSGYFWIRSSPTTYANGSRVLSADSGGTWSADTTRDYNFKTYMRGPYSPTSGNLVSAAKDANPTAGFTPIWSTLSWNGSTPANTSLQFQLAGSNNVNGPFNFVGPDGTAGTFFTTSPANLQPQFYNFRYLEYKAYLATTDSSATPTLNDVTICFNDVDCSSTVATITPAPAAVCENSTGNTASGPAGMTSYAWGITNGTITSATNTQSITYTAGASGTVTLNLTVTAPNGCIVSGSQPVTINPLPATPTITPGGPTTFCQGGSVTLTSSSATGNQWYLNGNPIGGETNSTYVATASGNYTVVVTTNGCASASSSVTTVTVNPLPPTPTITPGGPTTFCQGGSVTLTSSSASGNQWYLNGNPIGGETNTSYVATASGNYTVKVTDGNSCTSAASAATSVTVNPLPPTPTITPGGPTTFCQGGSVTLTSSSATGNQWRLNGNPIGGATNNTYVATASGNYTVVVTDANSCVSSPSAATSVTVNPTPATPTITPGGPTTFCQGGSVTLTSSSATGNQWYLNGNPVGGATNNTYVATASGNYTVVNTQLGCPSAPSAATTVTVNPNPNATITTAAQECAGSTGNTASVANAGAGATYNWSITNGTITGGTGTTNITYTAGAAGTLTLNLTVTTAAGCSDSKSANVTINAIPAKPTITPGGPTTFPTGGSVTLNSSSATGNQWYLNGNPIGGATNSSFVANASGNYTVVVTTSGCSSPASNPTTVTTCLSTPVVTNANDSGAGSLRQAILDACDGATITFDMNQVVSPINLTTADLVIDKNLTITGPGANLLTVRRSTVSGTPEFRIFTINAGKVVTINGLTISNGKLTNGFGAGIFNLNGSLNLNNSAVNGNSTSGTGTGGGICNSAQASGTATMTITNSTVSGNSAPGNGVGGGIDNVAASGATATMTIANSTVSGNSAFFGGGIANRGNTATLTITNGTVSGNSALNNTGGISQSNGAPVTILRNTIVAGNTNSSAAPDDIGAAVDPSSSFNLIGNGGSGGLTNGVNSNQVGVANALLAPLANYGGPTQTQALLPGSPAINAGSNTLANNAGLTTDQRGTGFNRIVNTTVDIGAFESRGFTISATSGSGQSAVFSTAFSSPLLATVSSAFSEPVIGGQVTFTAPGSGASATFTGGVTTLALAINASGQASVSATANATVGGPYNVVASTAGSPTPANFALTNTQSNQTITFNALGNKTWGDADFNVSATASSGLPVSFTAGGNCTISTNTVHLTGAGSCTITAKQAGNSNFTAAPDVPRAFTIAQAATTTAVNSSANPSNLTQTVTFTATVSGPAGTGTPTGTVAFKDGAATITCANAGGQTLNASGAATCQTSALTAGSHTITAVYSGDTNFLTSTGTLSPNQFVNNLPLVSFSAANYNVNESDGVVHVIVNRSGDTTVPFNVDYSTNDTGASTNCAALNTGLASSRCDYDTMLGTLKFAANQTQATIDVTINQDGRTEGPENFTIGLSNTTGGALLVNPATATLTINDSTSPAPNANDDTTAFVRQQYHDFLNREPDAAGLAFWVQNIDKCSDPAQRAPGQTQAQCIQTQRVITSAAFFLSIEFMQSGTFVRSFYVAALDRPATNNMPSFIEWLRDTQAVQRGVIVNQGNWQATLDANRLAFMQDFVMRAEFVGLYPTTDTPTQYINKLYNHALSRTPTAAELSDALSVFGGAPTAGDPTARGQALLKVTRAADFIAREIPRAFVQFEYFGYLRRNPNDAPDNNFSGYNFWLNKLNQFGGDFLQAEMVRAFIESPEYRQRFGN